MKKMYFTLLACFVVHALWAQLNVYVNAATKDSVISTPFDTLNVANNENGKPLITDKVVGIRNVHNKISTYWLFFYFLPTDTKANQSITIAKSNYAYFLTDKGTYFRIPYNGRKFTYKYPEMAGFFVDISNYIQQLKNTKLTYIRLETSDLYHEINLKDAGSYRIASLLQTLEK